MAKAYVPKGRQLRPRCGKPIKYGIYPGEQVCGQPEGHRHRCMSVAAYKRYLQRQREVNATRYALKRDAINRARRARYSLDVVLARVRHQLDGRWPVPQRGVTE